MCSVKKKQKAKEAKKKKVAAKLNAGNGINIFVFLVFFSKSELTFPFAICHCLSVYRLSVCRLSVTLVRPTQVIEILGNVSTPFGTLAISDLSIKIFTEIVPCNPSVGG